KTQVRVNQIYGSHFEKEDPRLGILQRIFVNLPLNISYDDTGRVRIPFKSNYYDRKSLTYLNLETIAVDLLIQAYATAENRKQETSALSYDETSLLFRDLHPLLVHLGFLDLEDTQFIRRFYRDTSLFVPHANGDEWIDFGEAVSFIHYVLSGYENSKLMKENGLRTCITTIEQKPAYDHSCFKFEFIKNLNLYTDHLQMLNEYMQFLLHNSPGDFDLFVDNLMATVSDYVLQNQVFTEGELLKFHILMQYVETYMYRFDLDKSGYIDPVEADLFLDKFMAPIAILLGKNEVGFGDYIRAFFTYMLKYHQSPLDTSNHGGTVRFHVWLLAKRGWQFKGERLDLSYVLKILGGF
ncbi:MAG: hypothetical protein KDD40_00135, partial [Bdellovibrionales bacterium]|nr:hypothetical protein [Bdellovibrionales bacterium]